MRVELVCKAEVEMRMCPLLLPVLYFFNTTIWLVTLVYLGLSREVWRKTSKTAAVQHARVYLESRALDDDYSMQLDDC